MYSLEKRQTDLSMRDVELLNKLVPYSTYFEFRIVVYWSEEYIIDIHLGIIKFKYKIQATNEI